MDLIGTCFDVLNKPMPLMQRHVDIYRHKVIMGMHRRQRRDRSPLAGRGGHEYGAADGGVLGDGGALGMTTTSGRVMMMGTGDGEEGF